MECAACGFQNLPNARFCSGCGAPLEATAEASETRKTVTVLFADVTGSTALGERNDPEAMREVMARYFAEMRSVLERHGGTVEKFIGDAVMAVFGVPVVHEDDAVRAARAAWDMRSALTGLNAQLRQQFGFELQARIGVNTGEVVVGHGRETLATGDAVNVAARLQQAAEPGQVLLGDPTYRLARDVVEADPVGDIALKGKAEPVAAWRLTACRDVSATTRSVPHELIGPLVGRDRELQLLEQLFERCAAERTCQLVTLLGVAGIGKSRLLSEFTGRLINRAVVVGGRCLSYGDGVALWPLLEALRAYLGEPADDATGRARLEQLFAGDPDESQLVERLSAVAGFGGTPASLSDLQWAVRRWLELAASERPVVLVVDDLHWAETALLDVVDHLVDWTREVPVLVICLARPEFLDEHPHWGGGKLNATNLLLQPLAHDASSALLTTLLGPEATAAVADHVQNTAGGNPLFLEQLLAMLADDGTLVRTETGWHVEHEIGDLVVPPSIGTLLEARLDRLLAGERTCLEAASIAGQVFYPGAVREIVVDPDLVDDQLRALVRKQLVRPDRSDIVGEEAYRFEHVLVRDAAYAAVPKKRRAELHERFARWLDKRADALAASDVDEFVGYHLEQAVLLQREVSAAADSGKLLASEAVARLERAAEHSYSTDQPASAALLDRAIALTPPGRPQLELMLKAIRLVEHDNPEVMARAMRIRELAEASGFDDLVLRAQLFEASAQLLTDPVALADEVHALATSAVERFTAQGDLAGQLSAHDLLADVAHLRGRWDELATYGNRVIALAREIGDTVTVHHRTTFLGAAMVWGPTPATVALERLGEGPDPNAPRFIQGMWHWYSAAFRAYQAQPDRAREHASIALRLADQLHSPALEQSSGFFAFATALALGNLAEFEHVIQRSAHALAALKETASLSTLLPVIGRIRLATGDVDEALRLADRARELTNDVDPISQATWRSLEAQVRARRDDPDRAIELMEEAIEWIHRSDQTNEQGDIHEMFADVGEVIGDAAVVARELETSYELYTAKENIARARRVRARLDARR